MYDQSSKIQIVFIPITVVEKPKKDSPDAICFFPISGRPVEKKIRIRFGLNHSRLYTFPSELSSPE